MDLLGATYSQEGRLLFVVFCESCKSFEELVERYFACRDLILTLCKTEKRKLIDELFAEITEKLASGGRKITAADLRTRLSACTEELAFLQDPSSRLFAVEKRFLHVANCLPKRTSKLLLTAPIEPDHPSLLLLGTEQLFCCGGREPGWFLGTTSSKTYLITFPSTVTPQANLQNERSYHGLALLHRQIYALGGSKDHMSLSTCEKFSLDTGQWQELSHTLATGRAYINPLIYNEQIYILGAVIEVLDPRNDQISTLPISLPLHGACVSVFLAPDTALVLSESGNYEVALGSFCCVKISGPQGLLWSSQPAVLRKGTIFLIDELLAFKCFSLSGVLLDKVQL